MPTLPRSGHLAVAEGYRLNLPMRTARGAHDVAPLLVVDDPAVVVETVKLAEDRSGDVVVRLYEALGGRATASIRPGFAHSSVVGTDLLERPLPAPSALVGGRLALRPFQIVTLRFARGPAEPPAPRSPSGSAGGPRGTGGVSSRAATRTAPSRW